MWRRTTSGLDTNWQPGETDVGLHVMPSLVTLLDKYRCGQGAIPTHTAIGGQGYSGGSYSIPDAYYEQFLDAYCTSVSNDAHPQNMTERPGLVFPLIADVDLEYYGPSGPEPIPRVHTTVFLCAIVKAYVNAILSMSRESPALIKAHVMQRRDPYEKSEGCWRDGVHLIFPTCIMSRPMQALVRRRALPELKAALETLPGQRLNVDDSIDACYSERSANWQMYGSAKPGRLQYWATHTISTICGGDRLSSHTAPVEDCKDWRTWVRACSVRLASPDHVWVLNEATKHEVEQLEEEAAQQELQRIQGTLFVAEDEPAPPEDSSALDALHRMDRDKLAQARELVSCLAEWRTHKYQAWRDVGFALRNTSPDLIDVWHEFSARSSKYDRRICQMFWERLTPRPESDPSRLSYGSLVFWAREDNPEMLTQIEKKDDSYRLEKAMRENNHTDWGEYMLHKLSGCVRCSPDDQAHALYIFKKSCHSWVQDEDGSSIKCMLKDTVVKEIDSLVEQRGNDADLLKAAAAAKKNLKTRGFRDNVVVDMKESVSDPDFRSLLDSKPHLIGWKNGVFDLEAKQFRDGRPEDFITMSCKHTYRPPDDPAYASIAEQFNDFICKVHADPVLRKYCLDSLSASLSGRTLFEHMHTWTGTGSNGKSRMIKLMDDALGDYMRTVPPSLLTSTRPESGKATPELCSAAGARILIMSEVDGKATINVAVMKELSGGDKIATRDLYKKSTTMTPQFTMFMTCNDLSKVDSNDDGTWRRLKVLPYRSKFVFGTPQAANEFPADTDLDGKLKLWAPYFLSMLQHRFPQAVKDMAVDPPEVKREVNNYRAASDLDQDFLAKNMVPMTEGGDQVEEADAWALLNTYRREGRETNVTLSKLQEKLARFGVPRAIEREPGRKVFPGWRLVSHGRI